MTILYGKPFAQKVEHKVRKRAARMRRKPKLAVVLAGNNRISARYVKRKGAVARSLGCGFAVHRLSANVSEKRVCALIGRLNKNRSVTGVIVQLPLPKNLDTETVLDAIAPRKDVDNLRGDSPYISPSVQAVWHFLSRAAKLSPRTPILIIGYGRLIGRPLHAFLEKKGFRNIKIADKKTKNLASLLRKADVVISATGRPNLVRSVKRGAIVIDAGAGFENGKIKGDVDIARVAKQAKIVTPVPGGVGPLTVAYLFKNLVSSK